jgi:signal transduction histidine kinase
LSSDRIRSLHEDEAGVLWIGTYDAGLNRFANGTFVPIRKRYGLYDDGVFAILDGGDGHYYMSSNRGIHSVAKRELDAFVSGASTHLTHRVWRKADGMPSSECNGGRQPSGFRADDGTLWFPTQGGIVILDPRAVPQNRLPPAVIVEEVAAGPRTLSPGAPIVLGPGERRLEVRYTATTFVRPEGARFRHRLAGYDDDWVEAGSRRFAQYANVPPGQYILTILAANSDGVWNTEGVSLPIRIEPYWWQTLWFRAAAGLLLVGLLATAYQRRVSSLHRRRTEQDAFARRLLEYQEAERKRIASELHDGIGQTLAVIHNRALLGLREQGGPATMRQMEEITAAAGQAIDEVRKVAYGLRPYQLDRLGLTRALHALVEGTAASSGILLEAAIADVNGLFATADEINVYRIVQEGVSNMIRHARSSKGYVAVVVRGQEIEIRLEDDGIGFDPAAEGGGLGLSGIAERARILGGQATVRSAPGQGTSLIVKIPVPTRSPPVRV